MRLHAQRSRIIFAQHSVTNNEFIEVLWSGLPQTLDSAVILGGGSSREFVSLDGDIDDVLNVFFRDPVSTETSDNVPDIVNTRPETRSPVIRFNQEGDDRLLYLIPILVSNPNWHFFVTRSLNFSKLMKTDLRDPV
jgi:hypothetical protein